jgi:GAF domain-containing protein
MLQSISGAFGSNRCLFLRSDKIGLNGFLSRLASEKKPLWVEEASSFQEEGVLLEEKDLLFPSFACIPLYDKTSFQGILYLGFSENRKFSPEEVDLLLLIAKEMGETIRNALLHQKAEETISELTGLHEMGKAVTSTLKSPRAHRRDRYENPEGQGRSVKGAGQEDRGVECQIQSGRVSSEPSR